MYENIDFRTNLCGIYSYEELVMDGKNLRNGSKFWLALMGSTTGKRTGERAPTNEFTMEQNSRPSNMERLALVCCMTCASNLVSASRIFRRLKCSSLTP
jgi:hypothetical protein